MESVMIKYEEVPVTVLTNSGSGIDATYKYKNGMNASEYFPPTSESAKYILTLSKSVTTSIAVREVEKELISVFEELCYAWPFAGGSNVRHENIVSTSSPNLISNAEELEEKIIAKEGMTKMSATFGISFSSGSTYSQFPLERALKILHGMDSDVALYRCLEKMYSARSSTEYWYSDLFKVREVLDKVFGNKKATVKALSSSNEDYKYFGRVLNNDDLRHAADLGMTPDPIPAEVKEKVHKIARQWIISYLSILGI